MWSHWIVVSMEVKFELEGIGEWRLPGVSYQNSGNRQYFPGWGLELEVVEK